eukprot:RCo020788
MPLRRLSVAVPSERTLKGCGAVAWEALFPVLLAQPIYLVPGAAGETTIVLLLLLLLLLLLMSVKWVSGSAGPCEAQANQNRLPKSTGSMVPGGGRWRGPA